MLFFSFWYVKLTMAEIVNSASGSAATPAASEYRIPHRLTMDRAVRIACNEDRPIMMDYWMYSISADPKEKPTIGVRPNKEKLLVKNKEEYTSPIQRMFKSEGEYIIVTENSVYIVDSSVKAVAIA